jgi:membrane-associated phospholipid phosphatase
MSSKKPVFNFGFNIYYLFLAIGILLLLLNEKGDVLLWINWNHNRLYDQFFKYWTYLGDGAVFAGLIILMLMISYYKAVVIGIAVISQTIVIQGLKRFVFSDMVRPRLYLENFNELHQVAGVDIHSYNSFPSGHTATAFTVAVLLSLFNRNIYMTGLLMVAAILVGVSRVYLLQHFLIDIYGGSIIGFMNAIIVYTWMESTSLSNNASLNKGLLRQ